MKRLFMLLLLQVITLTLFAQLYQHVNPQKDKMDYQGYTIKLIPAKGPGYGYAIYKDHQLVAHQSNNPFTMSVMGLNKKEDAYKVAQWQIRQLEHSSPNNAKFQQGQRVEAFSSVPGKDKRSFAPVQKENQGRLLINQSLPASVAKELQIDIH